jgi:hypothetical protein
LLRILLPKYSPCRQRGCANAGWWLALILSQPAENPAAAEIWILTEIWIFLISVSSREQNTCIFSHSYSSALYSASSSSSSRHSSSAAAGSSASDTNKPFDKQAQQGSAHAAHRTLSAQH